MENRHSVPLADAASGKKATEWDAVTKPAKDSRDWQAGASLMAVMYAAALAARRRSLRR